jgi:hypothetical protein
MLRPVCLFRIFCMPIPTNTFNHKHVLQYLNIAVLKSKSPDYICASSQIIWTIHPGT